MPIIAPIIEIVAIATSRMLISEAVWLCISLQSVATKRMAVNRNGASRPFKMATQRSALTALMFAKSIAIPTNVDTMMIA
jgi:hypothetical protein